MNEKQHKRAANAVTEQMSIDALDNGQFRVKGKYMVDPDAKSCDCPDAEYRVTFCKHLIRVLLELEMGNIERADADDDTPARPRTLLVKTAHIPDYLTERDQWVCWEQQLQTNKDGSERWTKVPRDVNGGFAKSNDPDTWASFEEAMSTHESTVISTHGVGFCLADDGDLVGVDFDKCRDPESGVVDKWAAELVHELNSYTEVSPSGTGLRVFIRGHKPDGANQTDEDEDEDIEVYDFGRYLTVTGHHVDSTPMEIREDSEAIADLQSEWLESEDED